MNLEEAKRVLGMIAGRESGMTTATINRDAARVILDHLAEQGETEWEYAWEADEAKRAELVPRGPRLMFDEHPDTPEAIAAFPCGRRVRRRKAGPWIAVPDTTNSESEGKA